MHPIRSLRRLVVSLVTLTALVVLCTASSCPPAPTTTLETCTEAALPGLGAKAPGLITQLIADLATGQWFAAVELTASAGGPFALCVLDYLRTVWGGGTPASNAVAARIPALPNGVTAAQAVARIEAYLAVKRVQIKVPLVVGVGAGQ